MGRKFYVAVSGAALILLAVTFSGAGGEGFFVKPTRLIRRVFNGDQTSDPNVPLRLVDPYDVAIDETQRLAYFSSPAIGKVIVLTFQGEFVRYVGKENEAEAEEGLIHPLGIDTDLQGLLYVADGQRRQVLIFDQQGRLIGKITPAADAETLSPPLPRDIAVTREGSVFVLDSANGQIQVFGPDREFRFKFSRYGVRPGTLKNPGYLIVSRDGSRIVVANTGMSNVCLFSRNGDFVGLWGERGTGIGKFGFLSGLAVDREDRVHAADLSTGTIQVFDLDGKYLFSLTSEDGNGLFAPRGIGIDSKDRLYACESTIDRVSILQMLGLKPAPPPEEPISLPDMVRSAKIEDLVDALKDDDWEVKRAAVTALGKTLDPRAVEPLTLVLKEDDTLRAAAIEALVMIGTPAIEPLINLLTDPNPHVQGRASLALSRITNQIYGVDQEKWRHWWERTKQPGEKEL